MLRLLIDRIETPQQMTIDIGSILIQFANVTQRSDASDVAFRIKSKISSLCESLATKRDLILIRKEGVLRRELLDRVFDWIAHAQSVSTRCLWEGDQVSNAPASDG